MWHNNATQKAIDTTNACGGRHWGIIGVCIKGNQNENIQLAVTPLVVNLPDGTVVRSMHKCDYEITGLPTLLEAHIIPDLTVASLIRICVLCKAGCVVIFRVVGSYT